MPVDFIGIDPSKKYGRKLERYCSMVREVRDLGRELAGVLLHFVEHPDYAAIEPAFGVPVSTGQFVYNLFVGAQARVDHADVTALVDRVG